MSEKTLEQAEKALLQEAEGLLKKGVTATELSVHFFGPSGRLASLYATPRQRAAFAKTNACERIQKMVSALRAKEAAAFDREIEGLSGRVTINVPRSLHAALKREAAVEHISLSELMRLKLSVPYRLTLRLGHE